MYAAVVQFPSGVKSPEAFRTISEVAAELDVPQHVLRFWESRFTQIKPTKRAGGRRYYRPEDVDLLRGIRTLLYSDGYTIKGVQKVLREKGLRHVAEVGRDSLRETAPARAGSREGKRLSLLQFEKPAHPLVEEEREKLEMLLAELVRLKARMRAAQKPV
jgi:DNA-binding transcriptional MerR regulator